MFRECESKEFDRKAMTRAEGIFWVEIELTGKSEVCGASVYRASRVILNLL